MFNGEAREARETRDARELMQGRGVPIPPPPASQFVANMPVDESHATVAGTLAFQAEMIDQLAKIAAVMERRLDPVLRVSRRAESGGAKAVPQPPVRLVTDVIDAHNGRLREIFERLSEIEGRINLE